MRVLTVLKGNLVVVEPRFETMFRHGNVDSCVTGCGSDSGLVYDVVCKARAIERAKVFVLYLCSNLLLLITTLLKLTVFEISVFFIFMLLYFPIDKIFVFYSSSKDNYYKR